MMGRAGFGRGLGKKERRPAGRALASYDVAVNTPNNERHWANADGLDADTSTNAFVRKKIRDRARYEIRNNTYARGIVDTLANDIVGTGPRLQMQTPNETLNRRIEDEFAAWVRDVRLGDKILLARKAQAESGEVFLIQKTNKRNSTPVKLDFEVVEADRVADPNQLTIGTADPRYFDGITVDEDGNPISYDVLKNHPGATRFGFNDFEFDRIAAKFVLHLFKPSRPGQVRGVSEIAAALPLFAYLRRYTLAVIAAAETAANNSYTIQSQHPALNEEDIAASGEPFDLIDIERNMATVMPAGWTLEQMKAEQPTTTYPDFKREILNEIARVLNMPFNVAAGNSAGYNYASGRLDHQTYFRTVGIEQTMLVRSAMDPIFAAWLDEARRVMPVIPDGQFRHSWFFDGFEHVDPSKEAQAQGLKLANLTTTLAHEYARKGLDWKEQIQQIAAEREFMSELGLSFAPASGVEDERDEDDDEDERESGVA